MLACFKGQHRHVQQKQSMVFLSSHVTRVYVHVQERRHKVGTDRHRERGWPERGAPHLCMPHLRWRLPSGTVSPSVKTVSNDAKFKVVQVQNAAASLTAPAKIRTVTPSRPIHVTHLMRHCKGISLHFSVIDRWFTNGSRC